MPFSYAENEFTNAWGAPSPPAATSATSTSSGLPSIQSTLAKERTIKDIIQLRDGLRGLLVRVTEVEAETDKLRKDNEFLGTYIDNL
jgi:hypothetical protein